MNRCSTKQVTINHVYHDIHAKSQEQGQGNSEEQDQGENEEQDKGQG